jgi:N-acetylglutamate synthase/N-acetylornithine aminotransferase
MMMLIVNYSHTAAGTQSADSCGVLLMAVSHYSNSYTIGASESDSIARSARRLPNSQSSSPFNNSRMERVEFFGIAKVAKSGMIKPNIANNVACCHIIMTDTIVVDKAILQKMMSEVVVVNILFNSMFVDGDKSTSGTIVLI